MSVEWSWCEKHGASVLHSSVTGCPRCMAVEQICKVADERAWQAIVNHVGVPWADAYATSSRVNRGGSGVGPIMEQALQRVVGDAAAKVAPGTPPPRVSFVTAEEVRRHRASREMARLLGDLGEYSAARVHPTRSAESEETGVVCPACGAKERRQKEGSSITTMLHADDCRRVREAPLVALVAAVPEGLDPVGWRAAVLAVDEYWKVRRCDVNTEGTSFWLPRVLRGEVQARPSSAVEAGLLAYRRALASSPKVEPERRRGGPVVVVDRGDDD